MSDKIMFSMPKSKKSTVFSLEKQKSIVWSRDKRTEYIKNHGSARFQALRNLQLSEFPLCQFCDHPATVLHHINTNMELFYERSNHASLCEGCHDKVNRAYRRGISTEILFKKKENTCQA